MVICTYPKLIAAYHVLHRLREPRHPPCALNYFLIYCQFNKVNPKINSTSSALVILNSIFNVIFQYVKELFIIVETINSGGYGFEPI